MMLPLKVIEDQKEIAALCKKTIQEIQDLKNTLYVKTESLGMIYKRQVFKNLKLGIAKPISMCYNSECKQDTEQNEETQLLS